MRGRDRSRPRTSPPPARRLDPRDGLLELLGTVRAPGDVAEAGRVARRQLQRVVEEVAPAAQVDGVAGPAGLLEAEHLGVEAHGLVERRREDLDVGQLGEQALGHGGLRPGSDPIRRRIGIGIRIRFYSAPPPPRQEATTAGAADGTPPYGFDRRRRARPVDRPRRASSRERRIAGARRRARRWWRWPGRRPRTSSAARSGCHGRACGARAPSSAGRRRPRAGGRSRSRPRSG